MAGCAAFGYDSAFPSGKRAAATLGVSDTTVSAMRRHGDGALLDVLEQIDLLSADLHANPGALVAAVSIALAQSLMPLSDADLVRRIRHLMDREAEAEGEENKETAALCWAKDSQSLEEAMQREVGFQVDLIAALREARQRGLDWRTWGRS